jgi:DNA-directed RNA polymerase subunit RPC12/RpoP
MCAGTVLPAIPHPAVSPGAFSGIRCKSCGSADIWKWGRTRGWRRALADLLGKRWLKCRSCGSRFMVPQVPSESAAVAEEDDED